MSCRVGHNWCRVGTNDWGMSGVMWGDFSVVRRSVRGQHWGVMNCMMGSGRGMIGGNSCMVSCMLGSNSCMMDCMMRGNSCMMDCMVGSSDCMIGGNSCMVDCMVGSNSRMMDCMIGGNSCMMGVGSNSRMMDCMMGRSDCMMSCMMGSYSKSQLSMSRVTGLNDLRGRPHLSRWFAPGVSAARSLLSSEDLRGERASIADPVAVSELSVFPLRQRPTEPEFGAARGKGGAAVTPLNLVSSEHILF